MCVSVSHPRKEMEVVQKSPKSTLKTYGEINTVPDVNFCFAVLPVSEFPKAHSLLYLPTKQSSFPGWVVDLETHIWNSVLGGSNESGRCKSRNTVGMEKLSDFLLNMDLSVTPEGLPVLSAEEEQDVLDQLGVGENPREDQPALELIMSKMKNVREFSLATGDAAIEAENDEEFADYGTVIIKTKSGKSTEGTLRVKKGDDRFGSIIFRGGDIEQSDLPADAFSTMRVIETAGGDDAKPLWASSGSQSDSSNTSEVRPFFHLFFCLLTRFFNHEPLEFSLLGLPTIFEALSCSAFHFIEA